LKVDFDPSHACRAYLEGFPFNDSLSSASAVDIAAKLRAESSVTSGSQR
jgi:hypothetical protein